MGFPNLLAHCDHNTFPADHGAAAQCKRYGYLYPDGNKVRGRIQTASELLERGGVRWVGYRMGFQQFPDGVLSQVNVGPNPGPDSFTQFVERLFALQVGLKFIKGYYQRAKRFVRYLSTGF